VLAITAIAGCDPAAPDQSRLITDLVDRLGQSESMTFTAGYELADGATATVSRAQNPSRLALEYPGGKVVVGEREVTACATAAGGVVCTVSPASGAALPASLLDAASAAGLPAPASIADLLFSAAFDPHVAVDRRDTTLVGRHASCVSVSGLTEAPPFEACVTSDGVLGSLAGTVGGHPVQLTRTSYRTDVDATAFDPPAGATVIEQG
jgi:hypothetical protein